MGHHMVFSKHRCITRSLQCHQGPVMHRSMELRNHRCITHSLECHQGVRLMHRNNRVCPNLKYRCLGHKLRSRCMGNIPRCL